MNNRKRCWLEKYLVVFGLATLIMLSLTSTVQAQATDDEGEPEFELVTLRLEFNATDNEAEVVTVVDAEVGLKELKVIAPNDKTVSSLTSKNTPKLGQGEVLVKTSELSLDDIKAVYPAGVYQLRAKTVDGGDKVIEEVTLSHELLSASTISVNGQRVEWTPVTDAVGYFLELENAETEATLTVDLPGTATSFAIPNDLLLPNTEYEVSLGAIGANGNRVFSEISFTTGS
jgi:hypothetical protein